MRHSLLLFGIPLAISNIIQCAPTGKQPKPIDPLVDPNLSRAIAVLHDPNEKSFYIMKKTNDPTKHLGFPRGKGNKGEKSTSETAEREGHEETQIPKGKARTELGHLKLPDGVHKSTKKPKYQYAHVVDVDSKADLIYHQDGAKREGQWVHHTELLEHLKDEDMHKAGSWAMERLKYLEKGEGSGSGSGN